MNDDKVVDRPWLADRRLMRMLDYWHSRRPAPDLLPARAAIDPTELGAELLPYVAILEPVEDGRRFRFRLLGTELAKAVGVDLTGRHVDEVNSNQAYANYISDLYTQAMTIRRPVYAETRYRALSGRIGLTRRMVCPLANDGRKIDMFIAAQVFEVDTALGAPPAYTYADWFEPGPLIAIPGDGM